VYFLVSASVFRLGIGVAYLLVDPLQEARERERRRDWDTLAHRDRIRSALAAEVGALVAQRAEIATTVANAKRQMHQEGVLHPEVAFLQRADAYPHLYGTWSARAQAPFHGMPEVGEAHHAQADLAREGGLTVPDKLADVDALIAELLDRNLASPKHRPR
jgi:chorismate mutase